MFIILAAILTGCTVPKQQAATADFGPYPAGYQDQIQSYLDGRLKDPYSAQVEFGTPYKAGMYQGLLFGNGWDFGYAVKADVNAKNSYGGYTGSQPYYFFIRDGQLSRTLPDLLRAIKN